MKAQSLEVLQRELVPHHPDDNRLQGCVVMLTDAATPRKMRIAIAVSAEVFREYMTAFETHMLDGAERPERLS